MRRNFRNLTIVLIVILVIGLAIFGTILGLLTIGEIQNSTSDRAITALILGGIISLLVTSKLFYNEQFGVDIPLLRAYVVNDLLTGQALIFRPGWNAKWPWQRVGEIIIDLSIELEVTSGNPQNASAEKETYITGGGKKSFAVNVTWSSSYRPDKSSDEMLLHYAQNDPDLIRPLLGAQIQLFLSDVFIKNDREWILNHKSDINAGIAAFFVANAPNAFEAQFGIDVTTVQLSNIEHDEQTQNALTQAAIIDIAKEAIAALGGDEAARLTYMTLIGKVVQTHETFDIRVDGLENLQHFQMGGQPGGPGQRGRRQGRQGGAQPPPTPPAPPTPPVTPANP